MLLAFAASLSYLLRDPPFELVTESRWRIEERTEPRCEAPPRELVTWVLDTGEGSRTMHRSLRKTLGPSCEGGDCRARLAVRVHPEWVATPHFFSGWAEINIDVQVLRRVGDCVDRAHFVGNTRMDQGRRGRLEPVQHHMGRQVGELILRQFTAPLP